MATDTSANAVQVGAVESEQVRTTAQTMGRLASPVKQDMAPIEEAEDGEEQEQEPEMEGAILRQKLGGEGPVDDLDVAASYAEMEIQSMASQFAATVVDVTKAKPRCETADADDDEEGEDLAAMVGKPADHGQGSENESETEEEEDEAVPGLHHTSSSEDADESSDDEEDEEEAARHRQLREEIEKSLEQDAATTEPPKTANEVAETDVPVCKPTIEITPESRLARCGTILSMNEKSLMATVTSDSGENPLAEGSVLCLSDRSVLGCVDEVFGPVLMPMYLVRFEDADQIPKLAAIGQPVFFVTEASSYLQPDLLHTKGSDASNLYDEEADDAVYSDDEAEANAKRQLQHRKRNRVDSAPAQLQDLPQGRSRSSSGGFFVDYQPPQPTGRQRTGSGAWRGPARNHGRGHHGFRGFFQPIQAQPQGGITRYTSPGFVPGTMSNYSSQPPMPPPPPYGGVYGASYLPGGLSPQYGYPQYFEPPQQRGRYPPTYYGGPAPPLPPDAAEGQNPGFFEPNGQQYPPPPPHPSSYEYGR